MKCFFANTAIGYIYIGLRYFFGMTGFLFIEICSDYMSSDIFSIHFQQHVEQHAPILLQPGQ
jgi:uncharacterized membrane protein (DUF4010 family)